MVSLSSGGLETGHYILHKDLRQEVKEAPRVLLRIDCTDAFAVMAQAFDVVLQALAEIVFLQSQTLVADICNSKAHWHGQAECC